MTHIILSHIGFSTSDSVEIVQVYVIPDNNETHELRLSHETIRVPHVLRTPPWLFPDWFLLCNSVIDPITGSTCLRLLLRRFQYEPRHNQQFVCADITLPANSTADVLPMSISTHDVFTTADPNSRTELSSSTDGFARGLCLVVIDRDKIQIRKFTIDATGETCVGLVGDLSPLSLPSRCWEMVAFDGTRGRICWTLGNDRPYEISGLLMDIE
ncbi:hypothetical protein OG21DRAFT_668985 [Imleria badia]|nr:hypothetical protein OG21DRAFT_668985 [Imleria badia]